MALKSLAVSIALIILTPISVWANPVSFKDGYGIMPAYSKDWSDIELNYSLSRRDAIGGSYFHREGKDSTSDFGILQYNRLLARWNEMESQANTYASFGLGGRSDSENDASVAAYMALQADYETRRIYTVAAYERLQAPAGQAFDRLRARLGIAPYLAPIDQLQTWLVMQLDYMPQMKEEVELTPLMRLFYNNFAVELGVSFRGTPFFAAMAHF